ncbi:thermostable hemolysin [Yersinia ruckeri]
MSMNIQAPYQLLFAQNEQEENLLKQYIQREYSREFNAIIPHFLPHLLGLYRADGVLVGACGLNRGDSGALYLERYLDAPIEMIIATQTRRSVLRHRLVEIGNFACSESGDARIMFAAICRLLCENQLDYVVFTGTRKLRNIFHRLNLNPLELAPAL